MPGQAGIGAKVVNNGKGRLVLTAFKPQGTAKTSGQLKEGDLLIKVDGVRVSDANEAQQLLQGEPNSLVKIKIKRESTYGLLDMDISLVREIGNEHVLSHKHQGFQSAETKRHEETAAEMFAKIEHGQARLNNSQVKGPGYGKFSETEYAAFKAQHKKDDDANIAQAEAKYKEMMAQDAREAAAAADPKKEEKGLFGGLFGGGSTPKAEEQGIFGGLFGASEKPQSSGWFSGKSGKKSNDTWSQQMKDKATDEIIDYKIRRKFEKDNKRRAAGNHMWPWEAVEKDNKFMDKDIPMPWDYCTGSRKGASKSGR